MPRYVTFHNISCMTRQGAQDLGRRMTSDHDSGFQRFLVSLTSGHMIAEFEVASREVLEAWLKKSNMHYEWMARMDLEATLDGSRDL